MAACGGGLRSGRGVLGRVIPHGAGKWGGRKGEKELWRESKRASKGVLETAQGGDGERGYAPSPDEGQTGTGAGFLGEGREPNSTHSVGGRKGRQRAQAGQSFIMGEGHVTNLNLEEGGRNPEVLP